MINVVGDSSSGKTLLAIEAIANFAIQYPEAIIRYAEAESAFDLAYASTIGLPRERVEFYDPPIRTIESVHDGIIQAAQDCRKAEVPGFYVVDSLDALATNAELARAIDKDSYGTERAKKISEMCRRIIEPCATSNLTLFIISQVRKRIGITFGNPKVRSGGEALTFYCSQILWLNEIKRIKKTIRKIERAVGIDVRAKCSKNKAGLAYRECDFPILFGYGLDDMTANLGFLESVEGISVYGDNTTETRYKRQLARLRDAGGAEYRALRADLARRTRETWFDIEKDFLPKRSKYE